MKNNIVLIGMPGCGKSTCGVLSAKALCKRFIDTDLLIQEREKSGLQSIIEKKGYDYFSAAEESVLEDLNCENALISTGGSAVYYDGAMRHLKENGVVIYLKISFDVMMKRISNITTRGILLKKGETIRDMFDAREELYTRYADFIIDCDALQVEEVVEKICSAAK